MRPQAFAKGLALDVAIDSGSDDALIGDGDIIGLHISPKGRGDSAPVPGSLYAWTVEKFGGP